MTATGRTVFALIWLIVLIGAGWFIGQRLQISGDLRKFMPGRRDSRRDGEPEAARAADRGQATRTFEGFCREVWV
jgi:predicted exporter